MKTIREQFDEFLAKVNPANASQIQHQVLERMFYAGFMSCYLSMAEAAATEADGGRSTLAAYMREGDDYLKLMGQMRGKNVGRN